MTLGTPLVRSGPGRLSKTADSAESESRGTAGGLDLKPSISGALAAFGLAHAPRLRNTHRLTLGPIMRVQWIIIVGAVGLAIAWWEASILAGYFTIVGCMILYGLRVISLQLGDPSELDSE
jgi:hypothetical protein